MASLFIYNSTNLIVEKHSSRKVACELEVGERMMNFKSEAVAIKGVSYLENKQLSPQNIVFSLTPHQ